MTYDFDDNYEYYWGSQHGTYELFSEANPNDPKSMRALAERLLKEVEPGNFPVIQAHELALLLAANAHHFSRQWEDDYGMCPSGPSFEERECIRRGWVS